MKTEENSATLLPCPFCGSTDIYLNVEDIGVNEPVIEQEYFCTTCNSIAGHGCSSTKEAAREKWNRRESPWLPIEAAPRDETRVLVGRAPRFSDVAYWSPRRNDWEVEEELSLGFTPTHWMPLPEPPKGMNA